LVLLYYFTYIDDARSKQIKFTCTKQAKPIHEYKNIKRGLLKTIAAVWYKKPARTDKYHQTASPSKSMVPTDNAPIL